MDAPLARLAVPQQRDRDGAVFLLLLAGRENADPRGIPVQPPIRLVVEAERFPREAAQDRVTLYGPEPGTPRTPTVSFTVDGFTTGEVATALAKEALYLSNGHFYALTTAQRYGQEEHGFVRAGCACYTTMEEVDRLIEAVATL